MTTRRTPNRESPVLHRKALRDDTQPQPHDDNLTATRNIYPKLDNNDDINDDNQQLLESKTVNQNHDRDIDSDDNEINELNDSSYRKCLSYLNKYAFILLIVISLISLTASYFIYDGKRFVTQFGDYFGGDSSLVESPNRSQVFADRLKRIESEYDNVLTDKHVKVMQTAALKVLNNAVSRSSPAVILIIGSQDQTVVPKCIAKELVAAISEWYNESLPLEINGKQTDWYGISDSFELNFHTNKHHSIIVENVESISSEDIMALHQFTDHENAKFPNSVIVLTAHNPKKINIKRNARFKDMDEIATQLLELLWKHSMSEDQRGGLISRLTPSVVVTLPDETNQFKCNVDI